MAADHAMAIHLADGSGALRLYTWDRPTLSFGRNEPARGLYDETAADRAGIGFVRRPTGGRVVLHDRELTYAVAVPVSALGSLRDTYVAINEALVQALTGLGAPAELASDRFRVSGPAAGPCFDEPVPGEVVARGRKLVGSAQVRVGRVVLQHGSIIIAGDQSAVVRLGPGARTERPATLAGLLGSPPSLPRLETAVVEAFQARFPASWSERGPTERERETAHALEERYRSPEWTWRR